MYLILLALLDLLFLDLLMVGKCNKITNTTMFLCSQVLDLRYFAIFSKILDNNAALPSPNLISMWPVSNIPTMQFLSGIQ